MADKTLSISLTPQPLVLLTILFVALKLTNHIDWSWLWVLAPLWLPITIVIGGLLFVFLLILVVAGIVALCEAFR